MIVYINIVCFFIKWFISPTNNTVQRPNVKSHPPGISAGFLSNWWFSAARLHSAGESDIGNCLGQIVDLNWLPIGQPVLDKWEVSSRRRKTGGSFQILKSRHSKSCLFLMVKKTEKLDFCTSLNVKMIVVSRHFIFLMTGKCVKKNKKTNAMLWGNKERHIDSAKKKKKEREPTKSDANKWNPTSPARDTAGLWGV